MFAEPLKACHRVNLADLRFETCRASGPEGQHVNKTDSAVLATHLGTGISVKVQTHRSQHANKQYAVLLIAQKLALLTTQAEGENRALLRLFHHGVERGNPQRVIYGLEFQPVTVGPSGQDTSPSLATPFVAHSLHTLLIDGDVSTR